MKTIYVWTLAVLFMCSVLFPLFSLEKTTLSDEPSQSQSSQSIGNSNTDTFRVLITDTDTVEVINAVDYICGVVAAEMPASYEVEALKAQTIAAYTFACHRRNARKDKTYDVTDTVSDQAYISVQEQEQKWGENYHQYSNKIRGAVESVFGQILTYDGSPILAAYHSISGGKTEAAANIWGDAYPYLQMVESVGDVLSPDYLSSVSVSESDMKKAAENLGATVSGDAKKWLTDIKTSESGTVLTLKISGTEVTGKALRKELGLKSSNFDVAYADGKFNFTVRGYGHGMGMSQYGAQFMALQGSSYVEILNWYYPKATLQSK